MKKLSFWLLIYMFSFSSCTSFLDETDPNKIGKDNYYENESDMEMALTGAYAALRGSGYYKNMFLYTEVRSDNTEVQDPGANNGVPYQFDNYTLTSDNPNVKTHWADLYKCVLRSNIVLDHLGDITFSTPSRRETMEAEAKFLRALSYYYLVAQFGDVPVVTRELKTKDEIFAHTKRDPKAQVYDLIVSDLGSVIDSPVATLQNSDNVGRASKVAAYALLGKVLLTKAADETFAGDRNALLTAAKTNLMAAWGAKPFGSLSEIAYADVFDKDKQVACKENIFQVMYKGGNSDLSSDFAWTFQPSSQTGLTSMKSGYGQNMISQNMVDAYETGDIRKDISCGKSGSVNYIRKYIDLDDVNGYGANNWIVLRYADVALMIAEVKYQLREDDAASYLNYVRRRAGLSDYTGSDLRGAIAQERRVELAFENHRWFDLLRLYSHSELLTMMRAKNANFSEKDFLLPIPFDEHKLNPEKMYQNPHYN